MTLHTRRLPTVTLAKVLARAGEGSIYALDEQPTMVAKIYHDAHDAAGTEFDGPQGLNRRRKIAAMVLSSPSARIDSNGHVLLAWPEELLFDDGKPVGFLMRRVAIEDAVELHQLTNRTDREHPTPGGPNGLVSSHTCTWCTLR